MSDHSTDAEIIEEEFENAPSASRIAESLRDTGYDFFVAIADILDNSIDAKATSVWLNIGLDQETFEVNVSVTDNGVGMNRLGLQNALKYGADDSPGIDRLGKFGLGLKTASTALCRRIELISRDTVGGVVEFAALDLDEIANRNKWVNKYRTASIWETQELENYVGSNTGTVVRWAKIDRVLANYIELNGRPRLKALDKLVRDLHLHLGTVFQRFIDQSFDEIPNVEIFINDEKVEPWDPFCRSEIPEPYCDDTVQIQLGDSGSTADLVIRTYVLPREEAFSSPEVAKKSRINQDTQGVYVYRDGRLIHGPDWLNIYKMEPHYNLARVEINFTPALDAVFQIDIKKSRIILDQALVEELKSGFFNPVPSLAEQSRRKGQVPAGKGDSIHKPSDNIIKGKIGTLDIPKVGAEGANNQTAEITNNGGQQQVGIRIVRRENQPETHIEAVLSLQDGVLWEPSLINHKPGVSLNASHAFYQKAYLPNSSNTGVVQALDYLIWAVAQAELNNTNPDTRDAFQDFRIEVSRNLRKLVDSLPGPDDPSTDSDA